MNETVTASRWSKRITIKLSARKFAELKKKGRTALMQDLQVYQIKVKHSEPVFDAEGKQLTKAQIKKLARSL